MKISHRTHPILEKIEKNSLGKLGIVEADRATLDAGLHKLNNNWKPFCKYFRSNIQVLTEPFVDAIEKSRNKLCDPDLFIKEIGLKAGTFIQKRITICYYTYFTKDEFDYVILFFYFIDNVLYAYYSCNRGEHEGYISSSLLKSESRKQVDAFMNGMLGQLFLTLAFIKYADIEMKFVGANKRLREVNCKYINDTKSNIQILDSTWFTTLVKTDGFNVRGHFRLQPCGKALEDRKLIWINEFEKHGYTRHFKRPVSIEEFQS